VRAATVLAGALVAAAAAMAALAFAAGGDESAPAGPRPTATAIPGSTAAAPGGLAVWVANGCGGCHTFAPANANGMFAPDLALSLQGADRAYIRQSIVDPDAVAAPNWDTGVMPTDFGERISPDDLEKLVAFIEREVKR
jgi:mono/diheme cytochrome c family protein